jgi:Uma2 family endonuclease
VKDALDAPIAPEIAVEVYSPSNADEELAHKRVLYFEAGADEVWICGEDGKLTFYDDSGTIESSHRAPSFPSQIEI